MINRVLYGTLSILVVTHADIAYAEMLNVTEPPYSELVENGDYTAAIQAAVDDAAGASGLIVFVPPGTYKTSGPILLKSRVSILGSGPEASRIQSMGNYPVLQHIGAKGFTVGDVTIRDIQIRGNSNSDDKGVCVFSEYGGGWLLENVDLRLCNIGYYQGTSRNNILKDVQCDTCGTGFWFGPIDQSEGGTPDNTVFFDTVEAVNTVSYGLRIEGMTGLKAVNSSFLQGLHGVYAGDYDPVHTPRARIDGDPSNVPEVASARNIRWLHFTGVYTDSTRGEGWVLKGVSSSNPIRDVRMVNTWSGNSNADNQNVLIENFENIQIVGSSFYSSEGSALRARAGTGLLVSNLVVQQWDELAQGRPACRLENVMGAQLAGISGDAPKLNNRRTEIYLVELNACSRTSASHLTTHSSGLVQIHNSTWTSISNSATFNGSLPSVAETGESSDMTRIANVSGGRAPALYGANSAIVNTGTSTSPRLSVLGGSPQSPAVFLGSRDGSGFYEDTNGLSYSANGRRAAQFFEKSDGGASFLPGQHAENSLGLDTRMWSEAYVVDLRPGSGDAIWTSGVGSPEGRIAAPPGSLYTDTNGGPGLTLWVKESGVGSTGWSAK